ncbi:MAG: hypothetical protein GY799_05395 [Desulfobulbaceae bacterium]|nr:hypothetical protein [Desulfobulbaceae bacterium]
MRIYLIPDHLDIITPEKTAINGAFKIIDFSKKSWEEGGTISEEGADTSDIKVNISILNLALD